MAHSRFSWLTVAVLSMAFSTAASPSARSAEHEPEVVGIVFKGGGQVGDFDWMIKQGAYADAFFVFNDNVPQYTAFIAKDYSAGCASGGGNAIIRPYQCQTPRRAAGIPTGPDFGTLTPSTTQVINGAVENIRRVVRTEKYRRVFYNAADAEGNLGTGIFSPGEDVKRYIVDQLKLRLKNDQ